MMKGGCSRTTRLLAQRTAPGRDQGFILDFPYQQPNTKVGGTQSPWLDAEDDVVTCIPMPFGLNCAGSDSSNTDSWPAMQILSQDMPPTPFTLSASRCNGYPDPNMYGDSNARSGFRKQKAESGLNGSTTVMIRRTPPNLTQRKLMWELRYAGFSGLYDYIYIPLDRGLLARPMAFVNFTSSDAAERCFETFNGRALQSCCSADPVFVIPASVQGLAHNLAHHFECMKRGTDVRRNKEVGPLFQI